jgi:hypothetical protein
MQFLRIDSNTRLSDIASIVGQQNVDNMLAINCMERSADINQAYNKMVASFTSGDGVTFSRKIALLNQCSSDSEIFEYVALQDDESWILFSTVGTMIGYMRIPDAVTLPYSTKIIGGSSGAVSDDIYNKAMSNLKSGANVDPSIFNTYASVSATKIIGSYLTQPSLTQNFMMPWGKISLHSSMTDEMMDFPVYPNELSDSRRANYDTMPDMLYQYEPWQIYKSSGPRNCTLSFDMHRDMWTGDHRDGMCNKLIRFCEAACYPDYQGSAVNTAISTLYINGKPFVSGIITEVTPKWDTNSPIGLDGFYLHVVLSITFVEVATEQLNYSTVRQKGLIG